jgi:LmbE family N-acetylglucosaminyl deacetylase
MEFIADEHHLGTPESAWAASDRLRDLPVLPEIRSRRVLVVAPHPDDEIFGAAGLMQAMDDKCVEVIVVAVTDGEASHPLASRHHASDLRRIRRAESRVALDRLGPHPPVITRLGLPDGNVARHQEHLVTMLGDLLAHDDLCVAPWRSDGHPDHDACGEAALAASRAAGACVLGYLVWAWHWADPGGSDLPWGDCRRLDLTRRALARKRWATAAFRSQTRPLGADGGGAPLLPAPVLRRFWRPFEVFVEYGAGTR